MDLGLHGRVAVVAAASRGLGRGTALALAAEGCDLVVNARDATALAGLADACRALGARVVEAPGDATDPATPQRLVDLALEHLGRLDVAIANAGGPPPGRALEVGDDAILAAVEANLLGSVRLVRAAVGPMRAGGFGRIVCISSASVRQPIPGLALSNTARTGLLAWCRTAAADLAADPATASITLNLACPGLHDTDRIRELHGGVPPGRVGDAGDFGRIVAFLCSTSAAFVTGQAVLVEGGATTGL